MDQKEKYKPIRVWTKTHKTLRLLSALSQESMTELVDRLANEELQRAKKRGSVLP